MKERLLALAQKIDAMSVRERAILFATMAVIVIFVFDYTVITPQFVKQKKLSQQIRADRTKISEAQAIIEQKVRAHQIDPDAENKARLQQLRQQFNKAQENLLDMQKGLVTPDKMAGLLEDLLRRNGRLKLVSLKTLPVTHLYEPLVPKADKAGKPESGSTSAVSAIAKANEAAAEQKAMIAQAQSAAAREQKNAPPLPTADSAIFKHGVEITVEGSYLDLLNYMAALETMPWQVFWSQARLNVDEYPKTTLTLTLFTLSLDKKWLNL